MLSKNNTLYLPLVFLFVYPSISCYVISRDLSKGSSPETCLNQVLFKTIDVLIGDVHLVSETLTKGRDPKNLIFHKQSFCNTNKIKLKSYYF